jgi:hypothetical protein
MLKKTVNYLDPKGTENLNMLKAIVGLGSFYTNLKINKRKTNENRLS